MNPPLRVPDKSLHQSRTMPIAVTMDIYVKSMSDSQVNPAIALEIALENRELLN